MDSLLATKLFIPPARSNLIIRPRLMERLNGVLNFGLTLLSAPAGFGKSTLVSQWAHQNKSHLPVAWVSLDPGDNDPIRFWNYLITAIKEIRPTVGEKALGMLNSIQKYSTEATLTFLMNDISCLPEDLIVVLDDYHAITNDVINTGMSFLLDHLPNNMHFVIATRTDPGLPLARLRGRGTMQELRANDLRFTEQETRDLLREMLGFVMASETVNDLYERTEGWVVGLKMAALSMNGETDISSFVKSFSGNQRYIMDYLVEEVLERQSEDVRSFLLKTSVLGKLAASLCDVLVDGKGSQDILLKLEQSNLFTVPLDGSRRWYRYHTLFADLLRDQLKLISRPEEIIALHQRASQWYEEQGFPDDAVHHALEARDWERTIRLASIHSQELVGRGAWITLLNWLRPVPEHILRKHPQLYCRYASALQSAGKFEAAEDALAYLENTVKEEAGLQGEVAVLQAGLANLRGDETRAIELAEKALKLLSPESYALRCTASFILGMLQNAPSEKAQALLAESWDLGRKGGNHYYAAGAQSTLGFNLFIRGNLTESESAIQEAIDMEGQSPVAAVPL